MKKKGEIQICPVCREAYPVKQGLQCHACQGEGHYEFESVPSRNNFQHSLPANHDCRQFNDGRQ